MIIYPSEAMKKGKLGCDATENLCLIRSPSEADESLEWFRSWIKEFCDLTDKILNYQKSKVNAVL